MSILRQITLCVLVIIALFQQESYAVSTDVQSRTDQAIRLFHQCEYADALDICEDIMQSHPECPVGFLGAATIYFGIMRDHWINTYEATFDSLIALAIDKGKISIEKDKENAENYFLYGSALGIRGLYRMKRGNWFGAFKDGLRGYRNVRKSYNMNKQIYDAYYGLGLYYYWKSVKADKLTWLPFVKDEREKGFEFIDTAVRKGEFSSMEGKFTLVQLYYFEGMYQKAYDACASLSDRSGENPAWLYLMAKVSAKSSLWSDAETCYSKLLELLHASLFYHSNGFLAACHEGLAACAKAEGDVSRMERHINRALEYVMKRNETLEIDGPLESFESICRRLREKANDAGTVSSRRFDEK
ncbi:MAG: hypothetical protein V2J62_00720 [candidate division KSB1 bacterium]|jgi:tetratricopeptide (TPR) repeat protein|nr:hypothetical protein [candidate division KSB1 bacterium]